MPTLFYGVIKFKIYIGENAQNHTKNAVNRFAPQRPLADVGNLGKTDRVILSK